MSINKEKCMVTPISCQEAEGHCPNYLTVLQQNVVFHAWELPPLSPPNSLRDLFMGKGYTQAIHPHPQWQG